MIFSARRRPGPLRIAPKHHQTLRPSPIRHLSLNLENVLDPCRRLTNRLVTVRKPIEPVKMGIFNHGQRSGLIKIGIPVFDEMMLLETAPNAIIVPRCDPVAGCPRSPIVIDIDNNDEVKAEIQEPTKNEDSNDGRKVSPCSPKVNAEKADMEIEDASELHPKSEDSIQEMDWVHSPNEMALALDILQLTMHPGTSELDTPSGFMDDDQLSCFSSATEFSVPSSVLN